MKTLTARYIGEPGSKFEHGEIYRLEYTLGRRIYISVMDAFGNRGVYNTLKDFKEEWDMDNIADRYKPDNPRFE